MPLSLFVVGIASVMIACPSWRLWQVAAGCWRTQPADPIFQQVFASLILGFVQGLLRGR